MNDPPAMAANRSEGSPDSNHRRRDPSSRRWEGEMDGNSYFARQSLVRAGQCLLYFGLALLALQALSGAALVWCVATIKGCGPLTEPSIYPYLFGALPMCVGAGMIALAPIVAAIEKIFDKPAEAEEAANPTPTIAEFYGIKAQMSYEDAGSPIVRICCGPSTASVRLVDGEKVSGDELPPVAAQIVRQWISIRSRELHENWQRARAREPLKTIPGPDDA